MHRRPRSTPKMLIPAPHVAPGRRIGVMGGSFNPPHQGHLQVAETALRKLHLDELWWLVSPGNPLKDHGGLAAQEDRMEACRRLIGNSARMRVTGFEAALATAYTADTVEFLSERFPKARFVWVMGADNLATFHHWHRWREIAARIPLAIVDRPGWHLRALAAPAARALAASRVAESLAADLPDAQPPAWTFLTTHLSPLSSTELRENATNQAT